MRRKEEMEGGRGKKIRNLCVCVCEGCGGVGWGGSRHSAEMKWRPATVLKDTVRRCVIRNVHR